MGHWRMIDKYSLTSKILGVILLIGCFICSLPQFPKLHVLKREIVPKGAAPAITDALKCSLSLCAVLVFDIFVDLMSRNIFGNVKYFLSRACAILAISFPYGLHLFTLGTTLNNGIVPICLSFQIAVISFWTSDNVHFFGKSVWSQRSSIVLSFLLTSGSTTKYIFAESPYSSYTWIGDSFLLAWFILFSFKSVQWYFNIFQSTEAFSRALPLKDYICTVHVSCLLLYSVIQLCTANSFLLRTYSSYSTFTWTHQIYTTSALIMITSILTGRVLRADVIAAQVPQILTLLILFYPMY